MPKRVEKKYWEAVAWIAQNDEGAERDLDAIEGLATVAMASDLFRIEQREVTKHVLRMREKLEAINA